MWEWVVWSIVLTAAASTRLWDLGARAMSHDESLHAFLSFRLFTDGVYRHEPVYHGPLLYHVNALVYSWWGASDFSARLAPALAGILLVAALRAWRGLLGRRGAAIAAGLVTISPTLLFYSRHLRNDIYIAGATVLWTYGVLRYLDRPQRRWRYVVTLATALAFITKEVSFISGAIIGVFVAGVALAPARTADPARRRWLWRIAVDRDYGTPPGQWPGNREFDLYLRGDVAPLTPPATPR